MKKYSIILILISAVIIFVVGGYFYFKDNFGCRVQESRATPVSLSQANAFALKQANDNNRPFNWVNVGHYLVNDSLDKPKYYIFIFRKNEAIKFDTLEKLEENAKLFSDSSAEGADEKMRVKDIATVITGAVKEDKPLVSHYRGIPASMARKMEIREFVEKKFPGLTIGSLHYDSERDEGYYEIIGIISKEPTGDVIRVANNDIVTRSKMIRLSRDITQSSQEKYVYLGDKECRLLKKSLLERTAEFQKQWDGYK